jgi:SAM-dependent methyltransferase
LLQRRKLRRFFLARRSLGGGGFQILFQLKFLREAERVLKPRGRLVLTVWYFPIWKKTLLFLKNLIFKILFRTKIDFNDNFIGWGKKIKRYVHYFSQPELKKLVKKSGLSIKGVKILKRPTSSEKNILLVAEK